MLLPGYEKVTNLEIIPIKSPRYISIGDSYYFEQMEEHPETANRFKKLVFDEKLNSICPHALMLTARVVVDEFYEYNFAKIVIPGQCDHAKALYQASIYLENKYFNDTKKVVVDLGCDTASFDMEIDSNYDNIRTGGDGHFGDVIKYKQYFGAELMLELDGDLYSIEEFKHMLGYFFKEDKSNFYTDEDLDALYDIVREHILENNAVLEEEGLDR